MGNSSVGIPCAHHVGDDDNDSGYDDNNGGNDDNDGGDDDNDGGDDEDVDAGLAMLWRRKLVAATQVTEARGAFIILCAMPTLHFILYTMP